jgi:hypothetical protein
MSIYRAKALEHYHHRRLADVAVEPFSGRLILILWILLAILVFGGAWLLIWVNRSFPHA